MESESVDGIRIRAMTPEDLPEVNILLNKNFFTQEPLCVSTGVNTKQLDEKAQDETHISMIKQGTCLVAVDGNNSDRIVGVVLAHTRTSSDLDKRRKKSKTFGSISSFLSHIETEAKIFERYEVSKVLYSHITNVADYAQGKGIGLRLTKALMELGREMGLPLLVAYCTSFYSARQKEALGMDCAYSLAYADYKNVEGEVLFDPLPPPPHTHAHIMVGRL